MSLKYTSILFAILLSSCCCNTKETEKVPTQESEEMAYATIVLEAACGKCVYQMADTQKCSTWIRTQQGIFPLRGVSIDPKTNGLCSKAAPVNIAGRVHEGSYQSPYAKIISRNK